ncbi:HAD hydrolase family protein [Staphylococcus edaphicus]|uniref:HAD hydrolase family protein n=1 Tax=Staphylococcus edaphicus TaxID=1955013 RepID=UPI00321FBAEC
MIFASARPIRDLVPVVKDFKNHLLIGGNGSIISKKNDISIIEQIPQNEFTEIKKIIKENCINYIIDGKFNYSAHVNPKNKIYRQLDPDKLANNVSMDQIKKPIKIILIDVPEQLYTKLEKIFQKYNDCLSINYHKKDKNIDITAKDVNKFSTLKKVIGNQTYIAYGNDINDYELLKNAKKSFYVGKGLEEIDFDNIELVNNNATSVAKSLHCF